GGPYAGQAPEALDETVPLGGADSGNVQQLRRERALRAALAAVANAEPVRLVTRALKEPQRRAPPGQTQRLGAPGKEDLLVPLGEADHRQVGEPHLRRRGERGVELALPAVDHDEVGQCERLLLTPREVAGDHLVNGGVVVLLRQALDLELAVFRFPRTARLEPDEGARSEERRVGKEWRWRR